MPRSEELKLIARAQRGSPEAFRLLVDAYKERLFAFVWRMLRDHHETEDITQTAFVKAFQALKQYNAKYAFSTWLFTIAYRLCVNHLRKHRPVPTDLDFAQIGETTEDVHDAVAQTEDARRLRDAIWKSVEQLSEAQKTAVLLFYREGKSCDAIGRVLDVPAVTVKSHLHRARARLRAALAAELVDETVALEFLGRIRTA